MANVTVRCPDCTLEKTFDDDTVVPADWKNEAGELLCPNCNVPMRPLGASGAIAAEQAFNQAQQQLEPLPALETIETLSKRLEEIHQSRTRVLSAKTEWDTRKDAAKEAKAHYDAEVSTFLAVVGRLAAVVAPLPLFTSEAEAAAQEAAAQSEIIDAEAPPTMRELQDLLGKAGAVVDTAVMDTWTHEEEDQAARWARDQIAANERAKPGQSISVRWPKFLAKVAQKADSAALASAQ